MAADPSLGDCCFLQYQFLWRRDFGKKKNVCGPGNVNIWNSRTIGFHWLSQLTSLSFTYYFYLEKQR